MKLIVNNASVISSGMSSKFMKSPQKVENKENSEVLELNNGEFIIPSDNKITSIEMVDSSVQLNLKQSDGIKIKTSGSSILEISGKTGDVDVIGSDKSHITLNGVGHCDLQVSDNTVVYVDSAKSVSGKASDNAEVNHDGIIGEISKSSLINSDVLFDEVLLEKHEMAEKWKSKTVKEF